MSKILGLDYGEKRCGISITDDLRLIASPLDTINTNEIINYLAVSYTHLRAHETV